MASEDSGVIMRHYRNALLSFGVELAIQRVTTDLLVVVCLDGRCSAVVKDVLCVPRRQVAIVKTLE